MNINWISSLELYRRYYLDHEMKKKNTLQDVDPNLIEYLPLNASIVASIKKFKRKSNCRSIPKEIISLRIHEDHGHQILHQQKQYQS